MSDAIDYSSQGFMKLVSIFVCAIATFLFFFVALVILPEYNSFMGSELILFVVIMEPFVGFLLGSLLGFLTKSRIRISTDRMVFNDETRNLDDFGSVYYEGDNIETEISGHPPSGCNLILLLIVAPLVFVFAIFVFTPFLAGIIIAVSCPVLYSIAYHLAKRMTSIGTNMVKNPLYFRLTEYLNVQEALSTFKECQYVDHVLVKYRRTTSEALSLIDDVRVFLVTNTNPILEIEITLENMHKIGLELTLVIDKRLTASQKEESIKVDGTDALLTVKDTGMNTLLSISYSMNRFSERLALGNAKKNCNLVEAFLQELTQHDSELILPGSEASSS